MSCLMNYIRKGCKAASHEMVCHHETGCKAGFLSHTSSERGIITPYIRLFDSMRVIDIIMIVQVFDV